MSQLSPPMTLFIGRDRLAAKVLPLIRDHRMVSLVGPGGIGKTRLALHLADLSAGEFGGTVVVGLEAVSEADDVVWRFASALDLFDLSTRTALDKVVGHLRDRHTLIVVDNCEHLLEPVAALITSLLRNCPQLHVVTTSRESLGVTGEYVVTVPPLELPDPTAGPAEILSSDAVRLFVQRAAEAGRPLDVDEDNCATIAELCERLDGMPLALELAAVRLRSLTLDQVLARLDARFALLKGGHVRDTQWRHQTLRNLVDWSAERCTPSERLLWARLSVFAAGCDLSGLEAVAGFGELAPDDVLDILDHLITKSIVIAEPGETGMRYRQLVTLREYGAELAAARGETAELRRRHRDLVLDRARRMVKTWAGPSQPTWLARMRAEHADIVAALELSLTTPGEENIAAELAALLRYHWVTGRFMAPGRHRLEQVLASPEVQGAPRGEALWVAAWVALIQGDHSDGENHIREAAALAESLNSDPLRGQVHNWTGLLHLFRGEAADAIGHFSRAADLFGRLGDTSALQTTLFQYGLAQNYGATPAEALSTCARLIEISNANGESWCRAYGYWVRGLALWRQGELAKARAATITAMEIEATYLDGVAVAHLLSLSGCIAASGGCMDGAARLFGLADAVFTTLGTEVSSFGPGLAGDSAASREKGAHALGRSRWQELSVAPTGFPLPALLSRGIAELSGMSFAGETSFGLTRREAQIAELVADGLSNKEIARRLTISARTVDGHVEKILAKLTVGSRAQVAQRLRSQGSDPRAL